MGVHITLQRGFNRKLLLMWAVGLLLVLAIARPWPILPACIGAVAGAAIGMLQLRSIQTSPESFRTAGSAMQVRRAFWATSAGRWSIILLWVTAAILLGVAFVWGGNPLRGYLAGFFALRLTRESVTLPAASGVTNAA